MKRILVLGGYSGIAQEVLNVLAKQNTKLYLVGRDESKLQIIKQHLEAIGNSEVYIELADLKQFEHHEQILQNAIQTLKGLDLLFVCYGILPSQKELEASPAKSLDNYMVNAFSTISFVSLAANYFEKESRGTIAVVTSVAGDRGRKSNYFYGSAKACVDVFLEGLRHRLYGKNVKVITIKPGVVDTPMTMNLERKMLVSSPKTVAKDVIRALESKKPVFYTPWFWKYIMFVVKLLPRSIFYKFDF
jgi:short-subunit dehydrogenase